MVSMRSFRDRRRTGPRPLRARQAVHDDDRDSMAPHTTRQKASVRTGDQAQ